MTITGTELSATPLLDHLSDLEPISLDQLNEQARLMTRVDRKYFVPRALLAAMLGQMPGEFRVLEIDRARLFSYRTVYFDSPEFRFYRQHVQGRRHRYKVRTRTYCESGDCMLEVKSKGYRGQTVKERIDHDPLTPSDLTASDTAFIERIIGENAARLRPVLETVYRRATLCHDDQRVTLDLDLECISGNESHFGPSDVLVETKSPGGKGPLDRALLTAGVRPHSVSKYCVAASLLYPHLPGNAWRRTMRRYFDAPTTVAV
ncbi:polyphosphate polymerase domain-containing protein [Paramicrobacterium chengjingii]|uniref:Polyphosphate polymerase domain-containing protein n=1 Tax=Paramicrobacterium chengjingii TaxID=2769067 RepID=A0ABX6YJI9_9MICO|nr:polyphosphate polymerase domain-containing protein [Microbacterium chengjingii]QPZ38885.1 polyphosphate polymerase domain-containing protein [Microbacterium chengjingii]